MRKAATVKTLNASSSTANASPPEFPVAKTVIVQDAKIPKPKISTQIKDTQKK